MGAIDVFLHDCGPNFFLTPLNGPTGQSLTIADLCATRYPPPPLDVGAYPRHEEFIRALGDIENPYLERSYLWNLLTLPVFCRGVPVADIPSNQPFLWTPNLFAPVGNFYVSVFEERGSRRWELGSDPASLVLALLVPGTFTYRYVDRQRGVQVWKVPVASLGAAGLQTRLPLLEAVRLNLYDPDYYETADCQPLNRDDVPDDFPWMNHPVTVFTPRQIGLVRSMSEPFATADGLIADNDSRPLNTPNPHPLATPPRCFALK